MSFKSKVLAATAVLTLIGGAGAAGATSAWAATPTCTSCVHVQNNYAFRGALDALHQATAVNSPIGLWYENPSTTDPGADLLGVDVGTVTESLITSNDATVNDSSLNWFPYVGDTVIRLKYDPFGNGGANTYIGLNGTKLALRNDNPNSRWQEFIEVPVDSATDVPNGCAASVFAELKTCTRGTTAAANTAGVPDACGPLTGNTGSTPGPNDTIVTDSCVLIDVGQTQDPSDPMVVTDPADAFTGSLVQQDVAFASINQGDAYATNQVWNFED